MGPIGCPETSARNYHCTLRNSPEVHFAAAAWSHAKIIIIIIIIVVVIVVPSEVMVRPQPYFTHKDNTEYEIPLF